MRNLYLRLNINSRASNQEIKNAIENCNNVSLKKDATEVLLDLSRRNEYDIVHNTLNDIGILRTHLGLSHGDNWRSPESSDFTSEPSHGLSLYDELLLKIQQRSNGPKVDDSKSAVTGFRALIGWILLLSITYWHMDLNNWYMDTDNDKTTLPRTPQPSYSRQQEPAFKESALKLPLSGTIRKYVSSQGVAPLEIKTSAGSNYLVKLENATTGTKIIDVFIRGGSTIKVEVPLGTYQLKYATGQTWYGYKHNFGPSTGYSKADSTFRFYKNANGVSGYTVTLYQVSNGNLRTSHLSPEQF